MRESRFEDPLGGRGERLTLDQVGYLLAFVTRHHEARVIAIQRLTPELFDQGEETLSLYWRGVRRVIEANGNLPTDPTEASYQVTAACHAEAAFDSAMTVYTPEIREKVMGQVGMIQEVFHRFVASPEGAGYGFKLLDQFLVERAWSDPLMRSIGGVGPNQVITNPAAVVRHIESLWQKAVSVETDPGKIAISGDPTYRPPLPPVERTGIVFLDDLMAGGTAAGEAYCLLGGTSSGKTSMATQIAVTGAKVETDKASRGLPSGYWYYFSWEADMAEMEQRVYCHGAVINADTYRRKEDFSTAAALKPYEHDPRVNSPGHPPAGEVERLRAFAGAFGGRWSRLVLVDFSGKIEASGRSAGEGGLDEVIAYLARERARGRKAAGVVIDYAGTCLARMIESNTRYKIDDMYALLPTFINTCRVKIGKTNGCCVWVLHQLHGSQANRASGVGIHHSQARGSRNIADNADFAFTIGNRDMRTGAVTFRMSKPRRAAGREEPLILEFDGRFNTFYSDTAGKWAIDDQKKIVEKSVAAGLGAASIDPSEFDGFHRVDPTVI